jgi:hypothetical protein
MPVSEHWWRTRSADGASFRSAGNPRPAAARPRDRVPCLQARSSSLLRCLKINTRWTSSLQERWLSSQARPQTDTHWTVEQLMASVTELSVRLHCLEPICGFAAQSDSSVSDRPEARPCSDHACTYRDSGLLQYFCLKPRRPMASPQKYAARPARKETAARTRLMQLISQDRPRYQLLSRMSWRRHKGGHSRRAPRRVGPAIYSLAASPMLQNTCCTSLLGAPSTTSSSVPTPT